MSTSNRRVYDVLQIQVKKASELSHPNIAKIIGYSIQGEIRLLVCRYMPRGSLASVLFNGEYISHFSLVELLNEVQLSIKQYNGNKFN